MKTMTLDEVRKLPPLTAEEVAAVKSFKNTDFSDCPKQTKEELAKFRPWYEVHPDWYKPATSQKNQEAVRQISNSFFRY